MRLTPLLPHQLHHDCPKCGVPAGQWCRSGGTLARLLHVARCTEWPPLHICPSCDSRWPVVRLLVGQALCQDPWHDLEGLAQGCLDLG